MNWNPNHNYNFFCEINIDEFTNEVGKDFIINDFYDFLSKTSQYSNIENLKIIIIKNTFDKSFSIYHNDTLLMIVELNFSGKYFCKPYLIMHFLAKKILANINTDLANGLYNINERNVIDDLFYFNNECVDEKLNDYFYYLSLIFINEFNLDIQQTTLITYDYSSMIIDGFKKEFTIKNKNIKIEDLIYLIDIKGNSDNIIVTKIYENNFTESYHINLSDFFLQNKKLLVNE